MPSAPASSPARSSALTPTRRSSPAASPRWRASARRLAARRETLSGLSGLGDLVLTCGSPQSRNMSLGIELGKGQSLEDVLAKRLSVTEGVYTAGALVEMAAARGIEMPIAQAIHAVISGLATVDEAIEALLARPLRAEADMAALPAKAASSNHRPRHPIENRHTIAVIRQHQTARCPRNSLRPREHHALRTDLHRQAEQPRDPQGEPPRPSGISARPRRHARVRRPFHRARRSDDERKPRGDRGSDAQAARRIAAATRSPRPGCSHRSTFAPGCGPSTLPTRKSNREFRPWRIGCSNRSARPGRGTNRRSGPKGAEWTGVRNYQARNNMRAMKDGDLGFFYLSGGDKSAVGIVKV